MACVKRVDELSNNLEMIQGQMEIIEKLAPAVTEGSTGSSG